MNISKFWLVVLGILAGAVFLGDDGGDAAREIFSSVRNGGGAMLEAIGDGTRSLGGAIE